MHREVHRFGRGASRTGTRCERQLVSQPLPLDSDVTQTRTASWPLGECSSHGTTERVQLMLGGALPASSSGSSVLTGRTRRTSAKSRCSAQEAAVWQSDPNRAVPVRATTDARDRSRSSEAPPATARGVSIGAASSTVSERSCNTLRGMMPRCASSIEADTLYRVSPEASPGARTRRGRSSDPTNRGIASSRHRENHGKDVA